jgi:hypothetical protein
MQIDSSFNHMALQFSIAPIHAKYYWKDEVQSKEKPYSPSAFFTGPSLHPDFPNPSSVSSRLEVFGQESPSSSLATEKTLWCSAAAVDQSSKKTCCKP